MKQNYYKLLSADKDGMLMYQGKYYVVYVTHPNMPRPDRHLKQRKKHLALSLEGKSLCNMKVDFGEKKLDWDSPWQYVTEPRSGAGETCKTCYQKMESEIAELAEYDNQNHE